MTCAALLVLEAPVLKQLLEAALAGVCEYSDLAAAGDPRAGALLEAHSAVLREVMLALLIRARQRGEAPAQQILDDFDRWFYTTGEQRPPH